MLERSILGWVIIGLMIGVAAKLVRRGRDPGGLVVSVMVGIAGALLGGFVAQAGGLRVGASQLGAAAGGSAVLLLLYHVTLARRTR